ncbi:phosphoglycerate dehydrogenase [Calditrichota bacterium]
MKDNTPTAVASRSFSKHPVLRAELLEKYSNVRFNDEGLSLSGKALIDFAKGRQKIITALEKIDEEFLVASPELKVIAKYGVGHDMIDKQAMIKYGICLGWKGGVNKRSVSEMALSFMISLLHLIPQTNHEIRNGTWKNRKGKCLSNRIVGIIGCGNIGKDLTVLLQPFECKILVNDILDFPDFYSKYGLEPVGLEELLKSADIVTLHVPLDSSTRNMMNRDRLKLLNSETILLNLARGGLVDEEALKQMLKNGGLAAAGFDVFTTEPPVDQELLNLPNFLSTPHIGGSSEEAILAMGRAAIEGLDNNRIPSDDYPLGG